MFGKGIEHVVGKFYNLYNPEDNMLAVEKKIYDYTPWNLLDQAFSFFNITYHSPYLMTENDIPLGVYGKQNNINVPENFIATISLSCIP